MFFLQCMLHEHSVRSPSQLNVLAAASKSFNRFDAALKFIPRFVACFSYSMRIIFTPVEFLFCLCHLHFVRRCALVVDMFFILLFAVVFFRFACTHGWWGRFISSHKKSHSIASAFRIHMLLDATISRAQNNSYLHIPFQSMLPPAMGMHAPFKRPPKLDLSMIMNTHALQECSSLCMSQAKRKCLPPLSRGAQNFAFIKNGAVFMKVSKRGVDMLSGCAWHEFLKEKNKVRALLRDNVAAAQCAPAFTTKFWMSYVNGTIRLCSESPLVVAESMISWGRRLRDECELWAVELQLMGCLWTLQDAGVFHNDCHANNVMVKKGTVQQRSVHVLGQHYTVQSRYTPVLVDWDKCSTKRDSHVTRHVFRALNLFGGSCCVFDAVDYVAGTLCDDGSCHYATLMPSVAAFMGLV